MTGNSVNGVAVSMAAPFRWLMKSLDVGRRNPRALFGAVLFMLVAVVALTAVQMVAQLMLPPSPAVTMGVYAVMSVISWLVMPLLSGGVFRVVHGTDHGMPVRALDVLSLFGDRASGKRVILAALVYILIYLAFLALVSTTQIGAFFKEYFALAMSVPPGGQPDQAALLELIGRAPPGLALWTLLILLALTFWTHAWMFAIATASLRNQGVLASVGGAALGVLRNFLPLLGFVVVMSIAGLVLVLILSVVLALVIVAAAAISPVLGILVMVPLMLGLMLALYAVMFGFYYHGWREIFGEADLAPPVAQDAVAV